MPWASYFLAWRMSLHVKVLKPYDAFTSLCFAYRAFSQPRATLAAESFIEKLCFTLHPFLIYALLQDAEGAAKCASTRSKDMLPVDLEEVFLWHTGWICWLCPECRGKPCCHSAFSSTSTRGQLQPLFQWECITRMLDILAQLQHAEKRESSLGDARACLTIEGTQW
jgi:hypothetical protein